MLKRLENIFGRIWNNGRSRFQQTTPTPKHEHIEEFIRLIRETHYSFPSFFKTGGCFRLYEILKHHYPEAEPFWSHLEGHVYTRIDGVFYDILGSWKEPPSNLDPMLIDEKHIERAKHYIKNISFDYVARDAETRYKHKGLHEMRADVIRDNERSSHFRGQK